MTEYADDRMHEISFCQTFDPFTTPDRGLSRELDISRYKIRTIRKSMGVSAMMPKEHQDEELKRLSMRGFSIRFSDPYVITMVKEKKFVIADEMIDSAFNDIENDNKKKDFKIESYKLLFIEQSNDINKLRYDLNSAQEVLDNYKLEYLKSRKRFNRLTLFDRIFRWKGSTKRIFQ